MRILKNGRLSLKEKLLSIALKKTPSKVKRWAINKKIKAIGEVTELQFNPKNKDLYLEILLAGEKAPFELNIQNYAITNSKTPKMIVTKASTNRKWVSVLIDQYVIGKEFPLPTDKIDLIRDILEEKN